MYIEESYVNATSGCRLGDSGVYEAFTDNIGKLFRYAKQEFGRCTGKVYVDTSAGVQHIGWTFQKRVEYERSTETYLQEVWVVLHKEQPETRTTYCYVDIEQSRGREADE